MSVLKIYKEFSIKSMLVFLVLFYSLNSYSQGATQPEINSFTPAGIDQWVNTATGDFTYQIPLIDVGGYPITISYNSGITTDQEASMVGLGWNIDVGSIKRTVRGLPDDFKGDEVKREVYSKPNITWGIDFGPNLEVFGFDIEDYYDGPLSTSFGLGFYINNYYGYGTKIYSNVGINLPNKKLSLGVNSDSKKLGLDVTPSLSLTSVFGKNNSIIDGLKFSSVYNSTQGLQALNLGLVNKPTKTTGYRSIGSLNFVSPLSYYPSISIPKINKNLNTKIAYGLGYGGSYNPFTVDVYYSVEDIAQNVISRSAYGYLYSNYSENELDILDYNREKDGPIKKNTQILPIPNFTKDVFSVSAHGLSGTFQPFRNDVGILRDPLTTTKSVSDNIGYEVGPSHGGIDVTFINHNTSSGAWDIDDDLKSDIAFQNIQIDNLFENTYFKDISEKSIFNSNIYDNLGEEGAVSFFIKQNNASNVLTSSFGNRHILTPRLSNSQGFDIGQINGIQINPNRRPRKKLFSYLTALQADNFGISLDKSIKYYDVDYLLNSSADSLIQSRVNEYRKEHHLSEISVVNEEGYRYVYGLPVYNTLEKEVTFSIDSDYMIDAMGLVTYNNGDDIPNSGSGCDGFYDATTKAPYAYAYMLTSLLSPDYQDRTGDGITSDDYGTAIKFNYLLADDAYHWRMPLGERKANFDEGIKSNPNDNKANYVYGVKEVVYIQSIQTKTHTAIFEYQDRMDEYEVLNHEGKRDVDGNNMRALKTITLFTNEELKKVKPAYLKKIHFNYNYSLCKTTNQSQTIQSNDGPLNVIGSWIGNLFNNNATVLQESKPQGKLTLKSLYSTHNGNDQQPTDEYEFSYNESSNVYNPDYHLKAYNRWGSFKPVDENEDYYGVELDNADFPYVVQSGSEDTNSAVWSLRSIKMPSSSVMQIDYESDKYSYVQDKRAMKMFKIHGFANSTNPNVNDLDNDALFSGTGNSINVNKYMFIEYPGLNDEKLDLLVKDIIDKDEGNIYFKCLVDVIGEDNFEYVKGYGKIIDYDFHNNYSSNNLFWIEFEESSTGCTVDLPAHPITVNSINFAKLYMQDLITGTSCSNIFDTLTFNLSNIKNLIQDITTDDTNNYLFRCFNNWIIDTEMNGCKVVDLDKSFVRLYSDVEKYGGGHRVKKITISDQWNKMTAYNETKTNYGKEYIYIDGVASYEPIIGGDENPFRQPVTYMDKIPMAPNMEYLQELPVGEIHFPSPSVVYSKVIERNLVREKVSRNAVGDTEYQYYTAKDFPVKWEKYTTADLKIDKTPLLAPAGLFNKYQTMSASQGFSIQKNDMHGKLKSTSYFRGSGDQSVFSKTEYFYKTNDDGLDNYVTVMNNQGQVSEKMLGFDLDIYTDIRYFSDSTKTLGANFNIDLAPPPIPSIWPKIKKQRETLGTAVIQKVIYKQGILDSVVVTNDASVIATKNTMYDEETGDVILTETYNEYKDPIYNMTYPKHWGYPNTGGGYSNVMFRKTFNFAPDNSLVNDFGLQNADEIIGAINSATTISKAWVIEKNNKKYIIDRNGYLVNTNFTGQVIRSGKRNELSGSIMDITSGDININSPNPHYPNQKILNASAVLYKSIWRTQKISEADGCPLPTQVNPFIEGVLGNHRLEHNWVFLSDRDQLLSPSLVDLRDQGYYSNFGPFWYYNVNNNKWVWDDGDNWMFTNQVTEHDLSGNIIESKDALGRYSSSQLGYDKSLVVAVASNAELQNFGVDNFEDYSYYDNSCYTPHFSFVNQVFDESTDIDNDLDIFRTTFDSHTGLYSVALREGKSIELVKSLEINNDTQEHSVPYILDPNKDLVTDFNPTEGMYILSAWVKVHRPTGSEYLFSYLDHAEIKINNSQVFKPSGPIVEGWQKIQGVFELGSIFKIELINTSNSQIIFFDDVRVQPVKASVKSYVYNPLTMRLMSSLDENNYATFFEYNIKGELIRTKRETERGIMTIKEHNTYLTK